MSSCENGSQICKKIICMNAKYLNSLTHFGPMKYRVRKCTQKSKYEEKFVLKHVWKTPYHPSLLLHTLCYSSLYNFCSFSNPVNAIWWNTNNVTGTSQAIHKLHFHYLTLTSRIEGTTHCTCLWSLFLLECVCVC